MIQSPFCSDKLINCVLPVHVLSPRKNLFDSSFYAVFLNYLFFFLHLSSLGIPVVFFFSGFLVA